MTWQYTLFVLVLTIFTSTVIDYLTNMSMLPSFVVFVLLYVLFSSIGMKLGLRKED